MPDQRMSLRYGVNQADECWDFAWGPDREHIWRQLREIDTQVVRLFVFDKQAPDPVGEWKRFASYVRAVLEVGAAPMLTFGKLERPFDDPRAIRWFATRCADVVWNCIEEWGGDAVRNWSWCVLNEPNNSWISGGLTFEHYRALYEAIAEGVLRWLAPYLGGRRAMIGGPAVEGFPPFWWDWPWRFVHEIDNRLIGFVDWHRYADWRDCGENGAPWDERTYRSLMMSQAFDYELRARAVGELIAGRDILNVCGELNLHSHYTKPVRERFNYSVFAAAFYASALIHLIRGGVDLEMYWTGTEEAGGYGMLNARGEPRPAFHAKRLCAQYVRYGDRIWFPTADGDARGLDVVAARDEHDRTSVLFVHKEGEAATYALAAFGGLTAGSTVVLKIDEGTGNRVAQTRCTGEISFDGYGVAVVTTHIARTDDLGKLVGHDPV
jgi:hypothetical protein